MWWRGPSACERSFRPQTRTLMPKDLARIQSQREFAQKASGLRWLIETDQNAGPECPADQNGLCVSIWMELAELA